MDFTNGGNGLNGVSAANETNDGINQGTSQHTRGNGRTNGYKETSSMADNDRPDMSEMQRLLEEQEVQFKTIKRGDVVEGEVVHMDADEILVDIGLKSEGVLSTKELPASGYGSREELNVGDNVLVYVMQPETPEGHAIVSIKRARQERQWRIAQEQYERGELLEAEVIDYNKGGLIVNLEGIRGFVPISQILNLKREDNSESSETQQKLAGMVGRMLQLKIIEINRNRNRLILSERLAVQEWRARRREELLSELTVGEVRTGIVSNLANFGAFVDLGGADGLVHISQLAWSRVNHPSEVLKVGQQVEVQVLSVDKEKKKIALSIKRAEVDPWTTVEQRYFPGQLVTGTITKIAPFGAFARIEDGIEGLIHLSELPAGTTEPKQALHEGQEITVRILRIDAERRRLGLSVRQAEEGGVRTAEPAQPEAAAEPGAQAPAEGEAEAAAPAAAAATSATTPSRARPRQPQPEEQPTTAMAEAFRLAQQATQPEAASREQAEPQAEPAPQATAVSEATSEATPQATAPAQPEATSAQPEATSAQPTPASESEQGTATAEGATAPEATEGTSANATANATANVSAPEAANATGEGQEGHEASEPTDSMSDGAPYAEAQTIEQMEQKGDVPPPPLPTTQEA